jgi:hypothetical protein
MIRKGKFAVDKVKFKDGIGCCIWQILDEKTPDSGLCWDFDYKDLDTILYLLSELKTIEAEIYEEDNRTPIGKGNE